MEEDKNAEDVELSEEEKADAQRVFQTLDNTFKSAVDEEKVTWGDVAKKLSSADPHNPELIDGDQLLSELDELDARRADEAGANLSYAQLLDHYNQSGEMGRTAYRNGYREGYDAGMVELNSRGEAVAHAISLHHTSQNREVTIDVNTIVSEATVLYQFLSGQDTKETK